MRRERISEKSPRKKSCARSTLIAERDVCRRLPLPPKARNRKRRVVIDNSVLIDGISGFREPYVRGKNTSSDLLYRWAEKGNFLWLVKEDILDEYKEVLKRLGVRPNLIGKVVNLIRERAEEVKVRFFVEISPDPKDDPFCLCAEEGKADFIVTLNPKDFPQERLTASVIPPSYYTGWH